MEHPGKEGTKVVLKSQNLLHATTSELSSLPREEISTSIEQTTSSTSNKEQKCSLQKRYIFILMSCIACFIYTSHITNIGIATVAMVNLTALSINQSQSDECPAPIETEEAKSKEGDILWSSEIVGLALGALGLGSLITKIPGGRLAERFDSKKLVGFSLTMSSLFTLLIPAAARWGSYITIAVRFLAGLSLGPVIPAIVVMIGHWIPKTEKNLLTSVIFSGYSVGSCINPLIFASLCDSNFLGGWPSVFYITGFFGLMWSCFWFFLVIETPSKHPTISDKELKFILENSTVRKKSKCLAIPWMKILTSVQIWALICGYVALFWSFAFFIAVHSLYLGSILHMPIAMNGIHSSLPRIFRLLFQWPGAFFIHWMLKKKLFTPDVIVKSSIGLRILFATMLFSIVIFRNDVFVVEEQSRLNLMPESGVMATFSFLGITLVGCNQTLVTLFFILSYCLTGITDAELRTTASNMVPAFAGTVSGIAEFIGSSAHFIIPAIVGCLTRYEQTMAQWNKMFYINMAVIGSTSLFFVLFGSSKTESWAIQEGDEMENNIQESQTQQNK